MSKGVQSGIELVGAAVAAYYGDYRDAAALFAMAVSTNMANRQAIKARNAYNAGLQDRLAMVRKTTAPRQLVFGRCRLSGPVVFIASTGTNQTTLAFVVALAAHEVDAIETVYFNNQLLAINGAGEVTGMQSHDSFSTTTATTTVTLTNQPIAGTITATIRYGSAITPLTVGTVTGVHVVVSGATDGVLGQIDVYYQPNPDPYGSITRTQHTDTGAIVTGSDTFSLSASPDAGSVTVVQQASSSSANDAVPLTVAGVSGFNVTIAGGTPGKTARIYYQTSNGSTLAKITKYLGDSSQSADADLMRLFPGTWTSAHKMTGIAYLVVQLTYDNNAFISGVPDVSAVVRGYRCFDPRTGSTAWSENPALHTRALATDPLAGALQSTSIDDVAIASAANVCDTSTTYTLGTTDYVRPLYTSGYVYAVDQKPSDGLNDLCQAMGGSWIFTDGMLRVNPGAYRTPNPMVLDETWLTDDQAVQVQAGYAISDMVNAITASYADQYQDWRVVPLPRLAPAAYLEADGATLTQDVTYSAVTFAGQAQYIASCQLRRMRQGLVVKLTCNMRAWQQERFDVLPVSLARFGWVAKPFEVMAASWTPAGSIELTLQETSADIWDMDASFTAVDIAPNSLLPSPWGLPYPTGLAGSSGDSTLLTQIDGTVLPRLSITWDAITDARVLQGGFVDVRYWRLGDPVDVFETMKAAPTDTQLYLTGVRDGSLYGVMARCESVITQSGWSPQIIVGASGKTTPPANVSGEGYGLGNGRVHLYWTPDADADYRLTEIRQGASWSAGAQIGTPAGSTFDWFAPALGSYTLWFAHQNRSGTYSAMPTSLAVTVDATVNINVVNGALSSDSFVLAANASGHVSSFTGATSTMTVTNGTSDVTSSWTFAKVDSTGITSGLSGTNGNVCTVSGMTDAINSGYVDITATKTGFASITKRFTLAKSVAGASGAPGTDGSDAPLLTLALTSLAFTFDGLGVASPTSQTISATAILQNATGTPTFVCTLYNAAGTSIGTPTMGGSGDTRTLDLTGFAAAAYATITATLGSLADYQTVVRLTNGLDSVTGDLTNEAQTLVADSAGHVTSYAGASTQMIVYRGTTDDSANWSFARVDSTGLTTSISGNTVTVTALADGTDSSYTDITATRTGFPTITKRFTIAKSKGAVAINHANGGNLYVESDGPAPSQAIITFHSDGTITGALGDWYTGTPPSGCQIRMDTIGGTVSGADGSTSSLAGDCAYYVTRSSGLGVTNGSASYAILDSSNATIGSGIVHFTAQISD